MTRNLNHPLCWLFMVVVIHLDASKSECVHELCQKKALSLKTGRYQEKFLSRGFCL